MMSGKQRLLLIIGLLLIGACLHFGLCDWTLSRNLGRQNSDLALLATSQPFRDGQGQELKYDLGREYRGLLTSHGVSRTEGLVFGVAAPMATVLYAVYLALGWRRSRRITLGLCAHCGYDLRGAETSKCPECGRRVPP